MTPPGQSARLRALVVDVFFVGGGVYISYGSLFAVSVLVNRVLGTAELGRYGVALAVGQLAVQSVTGGFSALLKRDVSVAPGRVGELASVYLVLKGITAGVIYALVVAGALAGSALGLVSPDLLIPLALVVAAVGAEAIGQTFSEALQASGRNGVYSGILAVGAVALLGLVGGALWAGLGALAVYAALLVSRASTAAGAFAVFRQAAGGVTLRVQPERMRRVLAESWPLIVNGLVFAATARAGTLVLARFEGAVSVGVFTFASSVVAGVNMVGLSVGIVLFPILCQEFEGGGGRLRRMLYGSTAGLAVVGLCAIGALRVVEPLLLVIFGDLPANALPVLRLLALGLVPTFGSVAAGYLFLAIGKQREGMYFSFVQATVTLATLVGLTARFGLSGTAAALVVSQSLMLIVALIWLDGRHLARLAR